MHTHIHTYIHIGTGDNPDVWTYSSSKFGVCIIIIFMTLSVVFSLADSCNNKDTVSWRDAEGGSMLTEPLISTPKQRKAREVKIT